MWLFAVFMNCVWYDHSVGSGKGVGRRMQAVTVPAVPALVFRGEPWGDFVRGASLMKVRLGEYYLGRAPAVGSYDSAWARIIPELLGDAVAVGALSLPAGCSLDDFGLRVLASSESVSGKVLVPVPCRRPVEEGLYFDWFGARDGYVFEETFGSGGAAELVSTLAVVINDFVRKSAWSVS